MNNPIIRVSLPLRDNLVANGMSLPLDHARELHSALGATIAPFNLDNPA